MGERDPSLPDGDEEPKRDSGLAFILGLEDVISSKHRSGGRCESRRQHRLVPRLEGVGGQEHEGERLIHVGRRRQVLGRERGVCGRWGMRRVRSWMFFPSSIDGEHGSQVKPSCVVRIALFPSRGADQVGWRLVARWLS